MNQAIFPAVMLALTPVSGLWLSRAGKPLNGLLFNVHKLIALAAVVLTSFQFVKMLKITNAQAVLIFILILAGLCVPALFATGALMSIGRVDYDQMHTIHRVATGLFFISLAAAVFYLNGPGLV
jgi:hypothetical protein